MSIVRHAVEYHPHHGPGNGAWHRLYIGRGAGYRSWDFPWHTMSIHDPWWRTRPWVSYIPGATITWGWNLRVIGYQPPLRRRFVFQFKFNAGNQRRHYIPGWWI